MPSLNVDLKMANTGQEYPAIPVALIRQWMAEGRVTRDDFVRPVGARNWLKISLAPELLEDSTTTANGTWPASFEQPRSPASSGSEKLPVRQPNSDTTRTSNPRTGTDANTSASAMPQSSGFRPANPQPATGPRTDPSVPSTRALSDPQTTGKRPAFALDPRSVAPRPAVKQPTAPVQPAPAKGTAGGFFVETGVVNDVATSLDTLGIAAPANRRRRKKRVALEDSVLDLTPMIDVTFQLLIFFMVTNTLSEAVPIEVPRAVYGRGVSPTGMQSILITEKAEYYLGDSVDPQNQATSLDALVEEVTKNAQAAENPLEVIISAHRESKHVDVRQLMERLGGVSNLGAVRLGVEEEP
jgi:biopolymer transport protein ExbD